MSLPATFHFPAKYLCSKLRRAFKSPEILNFVQESFCQQAVHKFQQTEYFMSFLVNEINQSDGMKGIIVLNSNI